MLSDEQLEIISEALAPLFQYLEKEVIVDIARRIQKTLTYSRTAELQAMSMKELGFSPARIRKEAMKIGLDLLSNDEIKNCIKERRVELNNLIDTIEFDKQDLLRIYWDMFNDAKRKGKLTDARTILNDIARYNGVNPDEVKKEIAVLNFNLDGDKI